ncbi:MAG: HU family DNA-binding protein [Desulfovibrionaceae bacterium]|nr:HU family DNA-binding protein [Desulfovibrionaceae bacterium]
MPKSITKADMVESLLVRLPKKSKINRKQLKKIVESILNLLIEGIQKDGLVMLTGFGKFECRAKAQRLGHNPKTDEALLLPARNVVTFRVSKKFREELNLATDV